MKKIVKKSRPINLQLKTIHFPITAISSILHRISGIIIFFSVGFLLKTLKLSLHSDTEFQKIINNINDLNFFIKFIIFGIAVSLMYHIISGIRHLLMDFNCINDNLYIGQISSITILIITGVFSIFAGILLW